MTLHVVEADHALEHPRRARLLAAITAEPGLTFRQLVQSTGIPAGTVRHHLTILERCGLVRIERDGGALRHFLEGASPEDRLAVTLERRGLDRVYAFVAVHGPVNQKTILDAMPYSRSTTQHKVQRLVQRGLMELKRQGRLCMYWVPGTV